MNFGLKLKTLMEESQLTQTELAKSIGFTQRAISKWVNLQSEPTETAILKVADYFSVSVDYLLGRTDDLGATIPTAQDLSRDEREVLELYDALSPTRKEDLMIFLRALSGNSSDTTSQKKA